MLNSSVYGGSKEKPSPFQFSVVLLINISHSFVCLLSVSISARTLARNTKVNTIYYRFTMDVFILMNVHLDIIVINNQFDAQFLLYVFISIFYMFRATLCSSSGESNCINTTSGICQSV